MIPVSVCGCSIHARLIGGIPMPTRVVKKIEWIKTTQWGVSLHFVKIRRVKS